LVVAGGRACRCGHCKRLEPEWAKAASELKGVAKVAALDATQHQAAAGRYGIQGYPTIKVFGANKKAPEDYTGPREADSIVAYAKDLAGRMQPPPDVVELTSAKVWDAECQVCACCLLLAACFIHTHGGRDVHCSRRARIGSAS
jgi:protein disulfide-isomerase A6